MKHRPIFISLLAVLFLNYNSVTAQIKEIQFKNPANFVGPDYLYLPEKLKPGVKYWLVVGVHGAKGRGKNAAGMKSWVTKYPNVIVLGPQFDHNGFQNGNGAHAKKLIDRFEELKKQYPLHDKMFIYGFSGGSQFGHRFAMYHPKYVIGCSAHSGGSWATRIYGKIDPKANDMPCAISCGEKDTGKAWGQAPLGRLDWFKEFEQEMKNKKMCFKSAIWPGVGHRKGPGVNKMTEDCFLIATTGMTSDKKKLLDSKIREAQSLIQEGKFDEVAPILRELKKTDFTSIEDEEWNDNSTAEKTRKDLVKPILKEQIALLDISPRARDRWNKLQNMLTEFNNGEAKDNKILVKFVLENPPKYWYNKKGTADLIKACDTACREHVKLLKEKKKFTHRAKSKCIDLWQGLPLRDELYTEYAADAEKEFEKIKNGPKRSKGYQKNKLTSFIRKWKTGKAVDEAKAILDKL